MMSKGKNYIVLIITVAFLLLSVIAYSQNPKGRYGTFALVNGTVETITQGTIVKGIVVISNGKIISVGKGIVPPSGAEIIDCAGMKIYPGMIDAGTKLGLSEIGSDPRTQDHHEVGEVVPQMSALTAINPNSIHIPVSRINGVTTVLSSPTGGLFPGTAALINLHGYTSEQTYAGFQAVILNFPSTGRKGQFDRRTEEEIKKIVENATEQLNDAWEKAIQYHKLDSAKKGNEISYYPELKSLLPVVRGEQTLIVEVNVADDILTAIKWLQQKKVKKAILSGVREGWRVAPKIALAGYPVITGPIMALPTREYDRYDKCYANAGLMTKAGVKVALRTGSTENVRNLPYQAGFAAAYGMGKEEALKAVTIVPAQLFEVADKLGSIEPGKNANIFVCDGDPFETKTQIKYVFINGWQIPLISRQTQLYDEFLKREPGLKKDN